MWYLTVIEQPICFYYICRYKDLNMDPNGNSKNVKPI